MTTNSLTAEREHLANLLEAVQRCTHFLYSSSTKVNWPLDGNVLKQRQKDEAVFEALAAFNERFAKLQDTLSAAMRLRPADERGQLTLFESACLV